MNFAVDGRKCSEQRARKVWAQRDPDQRSGAADRVFDQAMEQSSVGYSARFWVEQEGVSMRHANEEQG